MQASRKLRRAIEEDPNNLLAIAAMADQLAALGDVGTASSILREAGERNPDSREAIEERVAAYPSPG